MDAITNNRETLSPAYRRDHVFKLDIDSMNKRLGFKDVSNLERYTVSDLTGFKCIFSTLIFRASYVEWYFCVTMD